MFGFLKRLLGKGQAGSPRFSEVEYAEYDEQKRAGLQRVLGPMRDSVYHAIIPYAVGGPVDMYVFSKALPGTGFATMELLEPDGSGPLPSRIGTYELVAFTRLGLPVETDDAESPFSMVLLRLRGILTSIGRYSQEAVLNPLDTCEVPGDEGDDGHCLVLDEFRNPNTEFMIGSRRHGLLLVIEVFRGEMEYAREHGTRALLDRLRAAGHYPYSDLDRQPVV